MSSSDFVYFAVIYKITLIRTAVTFLAKNAAIRKYSELKNS